jgi:hypothetical protein
MCRVLDWRRELGIIALLTLMCVKIGVAFSTMMIGGMSFFEESMRAPLHRIGLPAAFQTVGVVLVPALSVVVTVRIMNGFIRFVLVALLFTVLVHASMPLVSTLFA